MTTDIEKLQRSIELALQVIESAARQIAGAVELHDIGGLSAAMTRDLDHIKTILHPPPEFEGMQVERLMCDKCFRVQGEFFNPAVEVCCCYKTGEPLEQWTYTKLSGTRKIAKKQPVVRRVSVSGVHINNIGQIYYTDASLLRFSGAENVTNGTLHFEWEE